MSIWKLRGIPPVKKLAGSHENAMAIIREEVPNIPIIWNDANIAFNKTLKAQRLLIQNSTLFTITVGNKTLGYSTEVML